MCTGKVAVQTRVLIYKFTIHFDLYIAIQGRQRDSPFDLDVSAFII